MSRVEQIRAMSDVVLRNLQITQFYHEAAIELRELTGQEDVNWFAFGSWASKTAGQFIRGEEVSEWAAELLAHDRAGRLDDLITEFLISMCAALANGNLLVFEELAPIAVTLVDALKSGGAINEFLAGLQQQQSPNGESHLARAVGAWHEAAATGDTVGRAQAILFANWNAVYHEQQRLQPLLEEAMALPIINELNRRVAESSESKAERFVERAVGRLVSQLSEDWRELNTRLLMHYELPGATLRLGHDVEPLVFGVPFPPPVASLTHQSAATFWDWLAGIPGVTGSAATDWLDLRERMRFIVTLFRAHQRNLRLFDPPFTVPQLEQIMRGELPAEFQRGRRDT